MCSSHAYCNNDNFLRKNSSLDCPIMLFVVPGLYCGIMLFVVSDCRHMQVPLGAIVACCLPCVAVSFLASLVFPLQKTVMICPMLWLCSQCLSLLVC